MLTARLGDRTVLSSDINTDEWSKIVSLNDDPYSHAVVSPLSGAPLEAWDYDGMRFFRPKPGFSDGLADVETIGMLRFKTEMVEAAEKRGHRTKVEYCPEGCPIAADVVVERKMQSPLAILLRFSCAEKDWVDDAKELMSHGFDVLALTHADYGTEGDWPQVNVMDYHDADKAAISYDGPYGVIQTSDVMRFYSDFDLQKIRFNAAWHTVDEFMGAVLANRCRVSQIRSPESLAIMTTNCWQCMQPILLWFCTWHNPQYERRHIWPPDAKMYPRGSRLEERYGLFAASWASSHVPSAKPCQIKDRKSPYGFRYRAFTCPYCGVSQGEAFVRDMKPDYVVPVWPDESSGDSRRVAFMF